MGRWASRWRAWPTEREKEEAVPVPGVTCVRIALLSMKTVISGLAFLQDIRITTHSCNASLDKYSSASDLVVRLYHPCPPSPEFESSTSLYLFSLLPQ